MENSPTRKIDGDVVDLCHRYTVLDLLGQGSFGTVAAGVDRETGKKLAIKHIHPMAHTPCRARHILREVTIMRILQHHPNIISLEDVHVDASTDTLYIVMELMECDLQRVIASRQVLTVDHVKVLLKQLLLGVQAMHSHGIIHRDLKPANILVLSDCQLRITDFGLSRRIESRSPDNKNNGTADDMNLTGYVCTRWYRAPEVMLGPEGGYAAPVDMWSVGCIFGEMLGTKGALFPGKNYIDQVSLTLATLGKPGKEWADALGYDLSKDALRFLKSVNFPKGRPLDSLVPSNIDEDAFQLLLAMLELNTQLRLTATQALDHAFLDIVPAIPTAATASAENDTAAETSMGGTDKSAANDFRFENTALTLGELRELITAEAALYGRSKGESCRHSGGGDVVQSLTQKLQSTVSLQDVLGVARGLVRQATEEDPEPGTWGEAGTAAGACLDPGSPMQAARVAHESLSCTENLVGAKDVGGNDTAVNGPPESAKPSEKEGGNRSVESVVDPERVGSGTGLEDEGERREAERGGQCSKKLDSGLGDTMHMGVVNKSAGAGGKLGGSSGIRNTPVQGSHVVVNNRLEIGVGSRPNSEEPGDSSGGSLAGIVGGVRGGTDGHSNDTGEPAEGADRRPTEEQARPTSSALLLADALGEQGTTRWQAEGSGEHDDTSPGLQEPERARENKVQVGEGAGQRSSGNGEPSSLLPSESNDEHSRRGRAVVKIQACARRMAASLRVAAIRRGTQTSSDDSLWDSDNNVKDTPQPTRKSPQHVVPMLPISSAVTPPSTGTQVQETAAAAASKAPREPLAILRRLKDRPENQPKTKTDQFRLRVTTRSAIEAHVRKTGALRRKARPLPTPPSWRRATTAAKHNRSQQPRTGRRPPLMQPRAVSPLHRSVTQLHWFVSAAAATKNREGSAGPSSRRVQDRLTCAIFEAEKLVDREFARRDRRKRATSTT